MLPRTVAAALTAAGLLMPAAAPAQLPFAENPWIGKGGGVLNIAHQGGELEAPSDTLYALKTAIDKGADMLELDVHLSADGQLVVIHDGTVDASLTLSTLVSNIGKAGGSFTYQFTEVISQNDEDGGEPGGNIRPAYL